MHGHLILLHGLGRTALSMKLPEWRLRAAGFETLNLGYPSRRQPIEALAESVRRRLLERLGTDERPLHFLTHSMGGIVLRCLVAERKPPRLGRTVMLCPPNQGNAIAERFADQRWFRALLGPAGRQLRKSAGAIAPRLGPVDFELGVITGNRGLNPFSRLVEGENDGKVAVHEARVEGMSDFLVVPSGHTFIMNNPVVLAEVEHFLLHGRFRATGRARAADESRTETM